MTNDFDANREAVLTSASHLLVVGGPGSGKTTLALEKALQRIQAGLSPGQSVLFLSFSRAAVARLAEAASQQIPVERRKQLYLQTFHSFFWELLRTYGYLLGAPRQLQILLPHDERALSNGVKQSDEAAWAEWLDERERLFREEGRIAFDVFASKSCELVRRSVYIRDALSGLHPLIIVDEAQDTGPDAWSFIAMFKDVCQIVCLADLEQQIFDHLPGIGPERIVAIRDELRPAEVDLGQTNNRSPDTEIAIFARDVLDNRARGAKYVGVGRLPYHPQATPLSLVFRRSLAVLVRNIRLGGGGRADSIAFLACTGRDVAWISSALSTAKKPVSHKVSFDAAGAILASRFAAFLLEPKEASLRLSLISEGLELIADLERSSGTSGGRDACLKLQGWARQIREGRRPRGKLPITIGNLIDSLYVNNFSGDPGKDWLAVKAMIRDSGDPAITRLAGLLDYLVAFNRGRRITAGLGAIWAEIGSYRGARAALDSALAQDALLSGGEDLSGVHVMTIHKSKGKQFDGVISVRRGVPIGANQWRSSFVWRDDAAPHVRSRKILRVGITRARKQVLILDPLYPSCPLFYGHSL